MTSQDLRDHGEFIGSRDGHGLKIALVVARFNEYVTSRLLESALGELTRLGVTASDRLIVHVPGSFELPLAAMKMASRSDVDAVICLGALIRGETAHFEYVAGATSDGIAQVARETGIPVIMGVITTYNAEQAVARTGLGADYAVAAVEMANLYLQLEGQYRKEVR